MIAGAEKPLSGQSLQTAADCHTAGTDGIGQFLLRNVQQVCFTGKQDPNDAFLRGPKK